MNPILQMILASIALLAIMVTPTLLVYKGYEMRIAQLTHERGYYKDKADYYFDGANKRYYLLMCGDVIRFRDEC